MDEPVLSLKEFKLLERADQTTLLKKYLSKMTKEELAKAWGCGFANINGWRKRLGLAEGRSTKPPKSSEVTMISPQEAVDTAYEEATPNESKNSLMVSSTVIYVNKRKSAFSLHLEKSMDGSEIKEALLSYASILDDKKIYDLLLDIGGD